MLSIVPNWAVSPPKPYGGQLTDGHHTVLDIPPMKLLKSYGRNLMDMGMLQCCP